MKRTAAVLLFALCLPLLASAASTAAVWEEAPLMNLTLLNQSVDINDTLWFTVDIYNPNNHTADGNLTVKMGRQKENSTGFEYPAEWVLMDDSLVSIGQASSVVMNFTWLANATEGLYKAYVRFDYNGTYTYRSKEFNVTSTTGGGGGGTWHRVLAEAEFDGVMRAIYTDFLLSCPSVADYNEENESEEKAFEVAYYPEMVFLGEAFSVHVRLYNGLAYSRNFTVYSYVYRDGACVSSGHDGSRWKGGWTANRREVTLEANETRIVLLHSRAEEAGEAMLKVRAKDIDDFVAPILVLEKEEAPFVKTNCSAVKESASISIKNLDRYALNLTVRHYGFGVDEKKTELKRGKNKTLRFISNSTTHYFLLISNKTILAECSAQFEPPAVNSTVEAPTGMSLVKRNSLKLGALLVIVIAVALFLKKRFSGRRNKPKPAEEENIDVLVKRLEV